MIRGELWRHGDDAALLGARRVEWWGERMRGLLGTREPPAHALYLAPCASVHTAGMRYAIDVAFLDREGRVLRVVEALRPWRIAGARGAHAVVELPAGALRRHGVARDDRLIWRPAA